MTTANIVAWLIMGAIVGLLVALFSRRETFGGLLLDTVVGIMGGFVGGFLLNAIGGIVGAEIIGVNLGGAVVAIVVAVILVALLEWMRRAQT
ncbi:MAG: GlsB/YeaQ/YmgE family stress response membrane protein [Anaerolineae bacterium]